MQLSSDLKGKMVEIIKLDFEDNYILHKLTNIGLVPKAQIKILDFNRSKKVLHIQLFNDQYVLREKDCRLIDVKIV